MSIIGKIANKVRNYNRERKYNLFVTCYKPTGLLKILEVHTKIFLLHYLPKELFDKILNKLGKSWATGNYMHLLGLRDIKKLLKKCGINKYKIIKNKVLGFRDSAINKCSKAMRSML